MFSATKFVVAGVIVALFGGFLLAGVLTQPSDESVPAMGTSPSASMEAETTFEATDGPAPTAEEIGSLVWERVEVPAGPVDYAGYLRSTGTYLIARPPDQTVVSRDGLRWSDVPVQGDVIDGYGGSLVVADGDRLSTVRVAAEAGAPEDLLLTIDGLALPKRVSRAGGKPLRLTETAYGPAGFVLVATSSKGCGDGGCQQSTVWHTADGQSWEQVYKSAGESWQEVIATADGFVATTDRGELRKNPDWTVLHSSDGREWARVNKRGPARHRLVGSTPFGSVLEEPFRGTGEYGRLVVADPDGLKPLAVPDEVEARWASSERDSSWGAGGLGLVGLGIADRLVTLSTDGITSHLGTLPDTAPRLLTGWNGFGRPVLHVAEDVVLLETYVCLEPDGVEVDCQELNAEGDKQVWFRGTPSATAEPDPAPTAETTDTNDGTNATPDLLPGVDLVTEEVQPSAFRVLSDGAGHDFANAGMPTVNGDGSVWMASTLVSESDRGTIFEVGRPGSHPVGSDSLAFAIDGTLWVSDGNQPQSVRSFDGETWTQRGRNPQPAGSEPDRLLPADYIVAFAVHPDGSVWQIGARHGDDTHPTLRHLGRDGWTTSAIGAGEAIADELPSLPCGEDLSEVNHLVITPDGTIWVSVDNSGLLRFDDNEWRVARPLGPDIDYCVTSVAANRDGVLWAEVQTVAGQPRLGDGRDLARFDGQGWEVFSNGPTSDLSAGADGDHAGPWRIEAVGPDGAVWLTDDSTEPGVPRRSFPVSFDGERWNRYPEVLEDWASDPLSESLRRPGVRQIAIGPDGTAWVAVGAGDERGHHNGLYVITPEAVAATE